MFFNCLHMKLSLFILVSLASLHTRSQPLMHLADPVTASEDSVLFATCDEGNPLYRGVTRSGKLHGNWVSWYASGKKCDEGKLQKGIPDGEWKTWYENGQLRHVRNYSYIKWNRIRDELNKPVKHPLYPITRLAKTKSGAGLRGLRPDKSFRGSAAGITLRDIVISNITNTMGYTPVFSQCVLHGEYLNYTDKGELLDSGYYKNGLRDGVWTEWSSDRLTRSTGAYRNGVRDREWKFYDANNRLRYMILYKQGQQKFRKEFS